MRLRTQREEVACPALAVVPLKHEGRIERCGNAVVPGESLCYVHRARLARGREVLVLPWNNVGLIESLAILTKLEVAFHHEKANRLRRARQDARMLEKGYVPK